MEIDDLIYEFNMQGIVERVNGHFNRFGIFAEGKRENGQIILSFTFDNPDPKYFFEGRMTELFEAECESIANPK